MYIKSFNHRIFLYFRMKTSKKIIAIFTLSSQLLCGCMTLADLDDRLIEKEDQYFDQLTDTHIQNFMSALENRDEDSFGSLFCETAKKSDASFSSSISNFFSFISERWPVIQKRIIIYWIQLCFCLLMLSVDSFSRDVSIKAPRKIGKGV